MIAGVATALAALFFAVTPSGLTCETVPLPGYSRLLTLNSDLRRLGTTIPCVLCACFGSRFHVSHEVGSSALALKKGV